MIVARVNAANTGDFDADGSMRVLDVYASPLDGLYAAGEVVGGFHGAGYYSGTGLGKAAVFGRIAGTAVAGE